MQFINIKSASFQSYSIYRKIFVEPPIEADESPNNVWKLNATIYGFTDASVHGI